jgi:hypothetical protein
LLLSWENCCNGSCGDEHGPMTSPLMVELLMIRMSTIHVDLSGPVPFRSSSVIVKRI